MKDIFTNPSSIKKAAAFMKGTGLIGSPRTNVLTAVS